MKTLTPQELRIGNLLLKHFSETEMMELGAKPIVVAADAKTIYDLSYYPDEFQKRYEPIPLTEEWLLKFGFKRTINNKDSGYRQYGLCRNGFDFMVCIELHCEPDVYVNSKMVIHAKYVHQLQNLFFALTGEEITIKEPIKSK